MDTSLPCTALELISGTKCYSNPSNRQESRSISDGEKNSGCHGKDSSLSSALVKDEHVFHSSLQPTLTTLEVMKSGYFNGDDVNDISDRRRQTSPPLFTSANLSRSADLSTSVNLSTIPTGPSQFSPIDDLSSLSPDLGLPYRRGVLQTAEQAPLHAPHVLSAINPISTGYQKPELSFVAMIATAIIASPAKKLLLCDIYKHIHESYPYYGHESRGWKNCVRHNLSLNDCFVKSGKSHVGKGNFWAINPVCLADFKNGNFKRSSIKRRVRTSRKATTFTKPLMPISSSACSASGDRILFSGINNCENVSKYNDPEYIPSVYYQSQYRDSLSGSMYPQLMDNEFSDGSVVGEFHVNSNLSDREPTSFSAYYPYHQMSPPDHANYYWPNGMHEHYQNNFLRPMSPAISVELARDNF